jgi:hypothetical protein
MTDAPDLCSHLQHVIAPAPSGDGCEDCLRTGGEWVHLRLCMACGHVGCCDDSPNRHASGHARHEAHPVIQSFEPGERWIWCFVDEIGVEPAE